MKNNVKNLVVIPFVSVVVIFATSVFAQVLPPQPPSAGHGQGGTQVPGAPSAPVGNGIAIMLALYAAYGARKAYGFRKKTNQGNQ